MSIGYPGPSRVVLVVDRYPELSETFIRAAFEGLVAAGADVHLVAWRDDSCAPTDLDRQRVHAVRHGHDRGATGRAIVGLAAAALRRPVVAARLVVEHLRRPNRRRVRHLLHSLLVVRLDPDLVHFQFGWNAVQMAGLGQALDARFVVSLRGADICYFGLDDPMYFARVWPIVDAVHCRSEDLWHRALPRGCPPAIPHAVVPPGVDISGFTPGDEARGADDGTLRLVSVGRLHWKKGHEWGLAALAVLLSRGVDAQLRIVGDGPFRPALERCIETLGLADHVDLIGARPHESVRVELQQADVFMHAAVSEGFCNAVLEAQAAAVPVVTSDAEGLAENVEDGVTGFVVPRRRPDLMADRLEGLADDAALRRRMGAAGRVRAGKFSPQAEVDGLLAIYETVMGVSCGAR